MGVGTVVLAGLRRTAAAGAAPARKDPNVEAVEGLRRNHISICDGGRGGCGDVRIAPKATLACRARQRCCAIVRVRQRCYAIVYDQGVESVLRVLGVMGVLGDDGRRIGVVDSVRPSRAYRLLRHKTTATAVGRHVATSVRHVSITSARC